MTLDPLATVKETTKQANRRVDADSQSPFVRVHCAHLVSDRADATDPRSDVRNFGEVTAAEEGLKKTGRLGDLELHIGNALTHQFDVKRTLALYAGQRVDTNCSRSAPGHVRSHSSLALRNCHAQALNPRNARATWLSVCPRIRNWLGSEGGFGGSLGPEQ